MERRQGGGLSPQAEEPVTALGLTQDDLAVGALTGYLEDGRFQISSLYVAPEYRRCGGGRMLLETLFEALDGSKKAMEDYQQSALFKTIRDLEQVIGGDGFSAEEQTAYEQQIRQRVEAGEDITLLNRFKTREMLEAEANARAEAEARARAAEQARVEAEEAARLKTGHIRTREEATNTHSDENYGQFYMEYHEFLQKFGRITRIKLPQAQPGVGAT